MKILAVDTSTQSGGVALLDGQDLIAGLYMTSTKTHAKRLMSDVDTMLRMANMGLNECDGFVVTTGPGSFTGLRIGISTVKGFAFATGKPVAGVSTLNVLACQFPWFSELVCPMLDARKGEIYTALYKYRSQDNWEQVSPECAVDPKEWLVQIKAPCLFVGNGAVLYRDLIKQELGDQARFAPPYLNIPQAAVAAWIGMRQIAKGGAVDVASLVPNYIRQSDAEIKRNAADGLFTKSSKLENRVR
ncbi:MAG: tRNA N6-adenosine(37)-N6-threonylcarbamoyltransferase complex dimerization subunit TsaB [Desulfobacterales bacterium S7086C20]|nr:MAG: tRNA N6-adenosine(37)-N6-threonylcarbamoyltransferase complex dimerization subunit TsaB [Desulfobacterales bacterium S7086C20]